MRIFSILRIATLALSLTAATGAMTAAFAAPPQPQQQNQTSPYDSQDFVIQSNNVNS